MPGELEEPGVLDAVSDCFEAPTGLMEEPFDPGVVFANSRDRGPPIDPVNDVDVCEACDA